MISITSYIKKIAKKSEVGYFESKLKDKYGFDTIIGPNVHDIHCVLRQIYNIFNPIPPSLIKKCGIKKLFLRNDMGPNKPYYPNHGYYDTLDEVVLNADIFYNPDLPDDFYDHRGYFITRPQQTLLHEFGHGYDWSHDKLSYKPEWISLSGWSETYEDGLKRLVINDKRAPKIIGEWFYDPQAEFTRFYAKRNPWDDFADCFSFYTAGMKNKIPSRKASYFNNLLGQYYK